METGRCLALVGRPTMDPKGEAAIELGSGVFVSDFQSGHSLPAFSF